MKIRVVRQNNQQEVLTVVGSLKVVDSNRPMKNRISHFRDATRNYYFRDSDGSYGGWELTKDAGIPAQGGKTK